MPEQYKYLVASADPSQLVEANAGIAETWKKLFPTQLYNGRLMETTMNMSLEHFDSVVILYTFLGMVAIIMSVSGLYSLVSLHLQKRTRELGIRKILGASMSNIALQSSKLFLVIMVISIVVGSILGSVMVNALMDSVWEYYVAVNPTVLTLATAILFMIALATIGYKVSRVVLANPVDSIKTE
jgi:ABC-type antimicrobial peptide transport system permease subunit